ncbi:hypothetical protein FJTKL_11246 [Diaporthe vaccinii]|uniref:Uncharacterized protein n=1 Tax=Diaporthe vaccinii TaxID=105482 RepID=A0ABR4EHR9_9PEZI
MSDAEKGNDLYSGGPTRDLPAPSAPADPSISPLTQDALESLHNRSKHCIAHLAVWVNRHQLLLPAPSYRQRTHCHANRTGLLFGLFTQGLLSRVQYLVPRWAWVLGRLVHWTAALCSFVEYSLGRFEVSAHGDDDAHNDEDNGIIPHHTTQTSDQELSQGCSMNTKSLGGWDLPVHQHQDRGLH